MFMIVRIEGIVASSAHFVCSDSSFEGVHGHNFRISVEVDGPTRDGIVVDFYKIRNMVSGVVQQLDHRLIVPRLCKKIRVEEMAKNLEIKLPSSRIRVPKGDVFFLDASNSTAEEIASFISRQLDQELPEDVRLVSVEVEEEPRSAAILRYSEED